MPLLDPADASARAEAVGVPGVLAQLHVFRTLLHRQKLAKGVADLLLALLVGAELDARRRELIILRVAWRTASAYEWGQHWRIALDVGLRVDELASVRDWGGADCFDPVDRLVLRAVDETVDHGAIGGETVEALVAALGHGAALEAVGAVGAWWMVSLLLRSVAVPLEADLPWWPPDGVGPGGDPADEGVADPVADQGRGPSGASRTRGAP